MEYFLDIIQEGNTGLMRAVDKHLRREKYQLDRTLQRMSQAIEKLVDPPRLARGAASEEEAMVHYRRVRDEIRQYVESLPRTVAGEKGTS